MKPIQWYKSLAMQKYRKRHGCFLIEGARAVEQILIYNGDSVVELLCVDDFDTSSLPQKNIPLRKISEANMKTICASKTPQGIAAVVRLPEDVYSQTLPQNFSQNLCGTILLLEDIQDPGNVGTLIRTAAAFNVCGIVLSGKCADPFSPKVVQSTAGSILSLWLRKTDDYITLINELRNNHAYKIIAADIDGSNISDFTKSANAHKKIIIALGNEGAGLTQELLDKSDHRLQIPINASGAESLNVAVSGGILLYEFSKSTQGTK